MARPVVKGWMNRGETIGLWGKVEHGKTTLIRELIICGSRGEPFLGRDTIKGRVFYAMLDADGPNLTYDELEKMGFTDEDANNVEFMFEPNLAQMEYGAEQFFRRLWDSRPDLVIIDPYARLKQLTDFNDYNNTYLMGMLSEYAKKLDAAFVLSGHIPRGRPAGAAVETAGFGSIAFGGGVNARFVVERKEGTQTHVLRTSRGKSAEFDGLEGEYVLERDLITGRVHLGSAYSFKDQAREFMPMVQAYLDGAPDEEFTAAAMSQVLGGLPGAVRAAANMLCEAGKILKLGNGKKGNPFTYKSCVLNKQKVGGQHEIFSKQRTPD